MIRQRRRLLEQREQRRPDLDAERHPGNRVVTRRDLRGRHQPRASRERVEPLVPSEDRCTLCLGDPGERCIVSREQRMLN